MSKNYNGFNLAGDLGGALIGGLFGLAGSHMAAKDSKRAAGEAAYANWYYNTLLQNHQYDLNMETLRNQYVNARQGLEAAGYNPILGYSNNSMSGSIGSPGISAPMAQTPDYGSILTNAMQTLSNIKLQNAQTKKINEETENIGNKPTNLIVNGLKGLFGFNNKSGTDVANELGNMVRQNYKKYSGIVDSIRNKLLNFSQSFSNSFDENVNNASQTFKLKATKFSNDISNNFNNYDTKIGNYKIHFTPDEVKLINEASKRSKKHYSKPPALFPI